MFSNLTTILNSLNVNPHKVVSDPAIQLLTKLNEDIFKNINADIIYNAGTCSNCAVINLTFEFEYTNSVILTPTAATLRITLRVANGNVQYTITKDGNFVASLSSVEAVLLEISKVLSL